MEELRLCLTGWWRYIKLTHCFHFLVISCWNVSVFLDFGISFTGRTFETTNNKEKLKSMNVCTWFVRFQALWEGPVPAVSALRAASSWIRLGNEGASVKAPLYRSQDSRTDGGCGCDAGPSSGLPVHLPAAGGIQRPLSSCTHHQQLPADPGEVRLLSLSCQWQTWIFTVRLSHLLTQETEHLKKFRVTWELHNKHLFENLVFSEPILHSNLPTLVAQLK